MAKVRLSICVCMYLFVHNTFLTCYITNNPYRIFTKFSAYVYFDSTLPYPTLLSYPTLITIYFFSIPILYNYFFTFNFYLPCLTLPNHRFTPTLPFPLFTPTWTLLVIPNTLFSITLNTLNQFTSNFRLPIFWHKRQCEVHSNRIMHGHKMSFKVIISYFI